MHKAKTSFMHFLIVNNLYFICFWIKYKFQPLGRATDEAVGDMNELNFLLFIKSIYTL